MTPLSEKELEARIYPLAKAAEDAGRFELLQGILLTVIAVSDLPEAELINVVGKLNMSIIAQVRSAQAGGDKILESVGLTKDKLQYLADRFKEQSNA